MGFIVFAIPIVVREELDALRKRLPYLAFAVVGVAFVVAVTLLSPVSGEGIDVAAKSLDLGWWRTCSWRRWRPSPQWCCRAYRLHAAADLRAVRAIMGAVRATMGLDLSYLLS